MAILPERAKCDACGEEDDMVRGYPALGSYSTRLPKGWQTVYPLGDFCPRHVHLAEAALARAKKEVRSAQP